MKLKDCPNIMQAFIEIERDNSGIYSRPILGDKRVPIKWVISFEVTEGVLAKAKKLKPGNLPKHLRGYDFEKFTLYDMIIACADDSSEWAMKKMKASATARAAVSAVLYEFFDGSLSQTFAGPRPTPQQALKSIH